MTSHISPNQVRKIKTLAGKLFGADDAAYREMLWGQAKVKSCKELRGAQIDLVIGHLEKSLGIDPKKQKKQLGLIYRLWRQVSRAPELERQKALRTFVKKRFGLGPPEWLTQAEMSRVIEGLKVMAGRQGSGVRGQGPEKAGG